MPTYKLTIAYDGTDFAGWQKQEPPAPTPVDGSASQVPRVSSRKLDPDLVPEKPGRIALRTVQAVVERAVREVVREPVVLLGASRTDSGVHAKQQVAVFTCSGEAGPHTNDSARRASSGWPESRGVDRLLQAINSRLGDDVLVLKAEVVDAAFHPIQDCLEKGYSYTYWVSKHRPLWERRWVWHTWNTLDLKAMQHAAAHFLGEHDFAAFAAAGHGKRSTVRKIHTCTVHETVHETVLNTTAGFTPPPQLVRLEISGNGFLYNMVRIIAGTLHEVGRGRIAADEVPRIIEGRDRTRAGPTLPPEGLCLEWIKYR